MTGEPRSTGAAARSTTHVIRASGASRRIAAAAGSAWTTSPMALSFTIRMCMLEGKVVLDTQTEQVTRDQVIEAYFGLGRVAAAERESV